MSRRKTPKTLSGIETCRRDVLVDLWWLRRKTPKTLSGIETYAVISRRVQHCAGKHLKPYQGLKQSYQQTLPDAEARLRRKTPKTLSGIETYRIRHSSLDTNYVPENT